MLRGVFCALFASAILCSRCASADPKPQTLENYLPTGFASHRAFSFPDQEMPLEAQLDFNVGRSFFRNPWVIAPASTDARDGLGPLFNSNACQNCHLGNGRGTLSAADQGQSPALLIRLGEPTEYAPPEAQEAWRKYGQQIQTLAYPPHQPEATVSIHYSYSRVTLQGGEVVELRKPEVSLTALAYGALPSTVPVSARLASPMIGLGLLQAIPEEALLNYEQQVLGSKNAQGRYNRVPAQGKLKVGRFGWKAGQPSILQQVGMALHQDLGLTSPSMPDQPCTPAQTLCASEVNGGTPEVSARITHFLEFYSANLAVPAQRGHHTRRVQQGEMIFNQIGCSHCHKSHWRTGQSDWPWLAQRDIYPYTDLMLHNMGEGLSDSVAEFSANGSDWRTPPLWGIGLTKAVVGDTFFLHDGRARNVQEAIVWHGGEAELSKQQYIRLPPIERAALIAFLNSL